jgi:hypothetical protein
MRIYWQIKSTKTSEFIVEAATAYISIHPNHVHPWPFILPITERAARRQMERKFKLDFSNWIKVESYIYKQIKD